MKCALLCVLIICAFNIQPVATQQSLSKKSSAPKSTIRNPQFEIPPTQTKARDSNPFTLPIRRVVLYSNGVAYIERRGIVSNHAEISLSFKQSQVDDVLKSMVVLDLGKGRIGAVSYNSSAPPSTRMAEIPFAISAATDGNSGGGLAGVLSQLQGARVVVAIGNRNVTGSILTVEVKHSQIDANKPPVTTQRLVIASDTGEVSAFDLADLRSVQLADEGARRDLTEFAHAAASARRRDAKTIVVTSDGTGEREMVVSYTIAAPIWKTTYRVVLDSTGKPFFQGWAIVDNISDEDWNAIQLSLVSGTPVSFIQQIQNPVYRYRPVIPLHQDLNLKPQTYDPGEGGGSSTGSVSGTVTDSAGSNVPGATIVITNETTNQSFEVTTNSDGAYHAQDLPSGNYRLNASATGFKKAAVTSLNISPGLRSNVNVRLEVGSVSETVTVTAAADTITSRQIDSLPIAGRNFSNLMALGSGAISRNSARDRETLSNMVAGGQSGVEAETTASEIGDLFEYRIDQPVTVQRDRSALIPILQTRMEGLRVSIFNEQGPAHRPMSGMLLKNTSTLTLDDGSLTVIDGDAYAGETLLERLKPGEERLISFALDLGTLINTHEEEGRQPTFMVKAVNGVVQAHYYNTRKKVYTLVNQTDHPRAVYLEHPIDSDDDWVLTDDTAKPVVRTANHYRFRVMLEPHQKVDFPVTERMEQYESYELTKFTRSELEFFVARKYIDEATRAVLEKLIDLKNQIGAADARLLQINKEAAEIAQDQQRLRENIKALTSTAEAKQLIARYVSKANEQESRMEQIEKDRRAVSDERSRLQSELDAAIRGLSLDRKLIS
jgi:archaellum component FlaC